jgi:hypothetical protein
MADVWGDFWKIRYLGLSASYFWSKTLEEWTWTLEVRFEF